VPDATPRVDKVACTNVVEPGCTTTWVEGSNVRGSQPIASTNTRQEKSSSRAPRISVVTSLPSSSISRTVPPVASAKKSSSVPAVAVLRPIKRIRSRRSTFKVLSLSFLWGLPSPGLWNGESVHAMSTRSKLSLSWDQPQSDWPSSSSPWEALTMPSYCASGTSPPSPSAISSIASSNAVKFSVICV